MLYGKEFFIDFLVIFIDFLSSRHIYMTGLDKGVISF